MHQNAELFINTNICILFICNTNRKKVTRPPLRALPPPNQQARLQNSVPVQLIDLSQSYSGLFLLSSLILKTSLKYFTRSKSLSRDLPSLKDAKYGHQRMWLWVSTLLRNVLKKEEGWQIMLLIIKYLIHKTQKFIKFLANKTA